MASPAALPEKTRVRRDLRILQGGAVAYLVAVLFGGGLLGMRWWVLVALALGVFPLGIFAMRVLTASMLREIASHPPRLVRCRGASPTEFEDVIDPEDLAGFDEFCWLRSASEGRRDIVGPVRHARTADGRVVVSIGAVGNATAISRLDDGRWFVTQWIPSVPLPDVVVQVAPNTPLHELLERHRDALDEAGARGRHTTPLEVVAAADALQQLENRAIAEMNHRERRRVAATMAGPGTGEPFDPAVF